MARRNGSILGASLFLGVSKVAFAQEGGSTAPPEDLGADPVVIVEDVPFLEPVVVPPIIVEGQTLFESFYDGLIVGMEYFGQAFPFLFTYFFAWILTIIWIPFAIRIARGVVRRSFKSWSDQTSTIEAKQIDKVRDTSSEMATKERT